MLFYFNLQIIIKFCYLKIINNFDFKMESITFTKKLKKKVLKYIEIFYHNWLDMNFTYFDNNNYPNENNESNLL